MKDYSNRNLKWLLYAAVVALCGCGGDVNVAEIAADQPWAALPSGSNMVVGFRPQAIVDHPAITALRNAIGQDQADPMLTDVIRAIGIDPLKYIEKEQGQTDLTMAGLIRSFGLNPHKQIETGLFACYGTSWGMALIGDLDRASFGKGTATAIEEKSVRDIDYIEMKRSLDTRTVTTYAVFPAPRIVLIFSNEALVKNAVAVWRGKADGMITDPNYAGQWETLSTDSAVWLTASAKGDSLDPGVDRCLGALQLEPESAKLAVLFECRSSDSAVKQSVDCEYRVNILARTQFDQGRGMGLVVLAAAIDYKPIEKEVHVSLDLTPKLLGNIVYAYQRTQRPTAPTADRPPLGSVKRAVVPPPRPPTSPLGM